MRMLYYRILVAGLLTLSFVMSPVPTSAQPVEPASTVGMVDLGALAPGYSKPAAINNRGQVVGQSSAGGLAAHAFVWEKGVMTDLGTLGGLFSSAADINDAGQIVGHSYTKTEAGGSSEIHAVLWHNGTITDLGHLGGGYSEATDINAVGQIVGMSATAGADHRDRETHAVLWDRGAIVDLGHLGGGYSEAVAINNRGQVTGLSATAGGEIHAFLWEKGTLTDLGTLGGLFAMPTAINDRGQVVGMSTLEGGQPFTGGDHDDEDDGDDPSTHAFLWEKGVMTDMGTLGGDFSEATAISDATAVAGNSATADGYIRAFVWKNGVMTDLGALPGGSSAATAINARGQVAGVSAVVAGGPQHAVLWDNGRMIDLGTLGSGASPIDYSSASALNDAGQVAGESYTGNAFHGFLWSTATQGCGSGGRGFYSNFRRHAVPPAAPALAEIFWLLVQGVFQEGTLPGRHRPSVGPSWKGARWRSCTLNARIGPQHTAADAVAWEHSCRNKPANNTIARSAIRVLICRAICRVI